MLTVDDYWKRCAEGEFAVQQCSNCQTWRFPLSPLCPVCLSREYSWEEPSGKGTVWSWIRMHQRYFPADDFDVPYEVAFVQLDEGPFLISGFAAGELPEIGDRVEVVFEMNKRGDQLLPKFRKAAA